MNKKGTLREEEANELVLEHRGWAESIARSVARAWNLDWQLDGLDGAAMEALIFCSRRFTPDRGVPFKGYARKRIHEASADAARKSKGWHKSSSSSKVQQNAREISMELLNVFPELRSGQLPAGDEGGTGGDSNRAGIRQLLMGASILASKEDAGPAVPDDVLDYKRMITHMASLALVHQLILWSVYWEGESMRGVASQWDTDELNVIREHKAILSFLNKCVSGHKPAKALRVRPGLRTIEAKLNKQKTAAPFTDIINKGR